MVFEWDFIVIQWDINGIYALVNKQFAIENCHLSLIYPLKMVIFHSYVSLPEGKHL